MSRSKTDITSIVKETINNFFLDKKFGTKITEKIEQKIKISRKRLKTKTIKP